MRTRKAALIRPICTCSLEAIKCRRESHRQLLLLSPFIFQEADEIKGATSWPDYYIDQLRCMSAVSHINLIPFKHKHSLHIWKCNDFSTSSILLICNGNASFSRGKLCCPLMRKTSGDIWSLMSWKQPWGHSQWGESLNESPISDIYSRQAYHWWWGLPYGHQREVNQ